MPRQKINHPRQSRRWSALFLGLNTPVFGRRVNDMTQGTKRLASKVILEIEDDFFVVFLVVAECGDNPIRLADGVDLAAELADIFQDVVDGFHGSY